MRQVQNIKHIGMKRAHALANLSTEKQFDLIAEGLPILMNSAANLLKAASSLRDHPRSAAMLERHAEEELAKILILIDLVRCPNSQRASRVGFMTRWLYDHLARLIYVDAQSWKPMHVKQLQEYIDTHRQSHYLEGSVGEYIMPNWEVYRRESDMYADIIGEEDGTLHWNDPQAIYHDELIRSIVGGEWDTPLVWRICSALQDFGAFSRAGLDVIAAAWEQADFKSSENWEDAKTLCHNMLCNLEKANLITESATEDQLGVLYHNWQLPMYRMDFSPVQVSLEELQAQRDLNLAHEMGY